LRRISTFISPQFVRFTEALALAGFQCENDHAFFVRTDVITSRAATQPPDLAA
jgi:hypothetical protein